VLSSLGRQLADEIAEERPGQSRMLDALLQQLAVHLLREHVRVRRSPTIERSRVGPVDRRLRRAVELMHAHADAELSLDDLADAAALSPSHFAHLFKDLVGLTPHAYLTNLRLERARALLIETELPVTEIAARVGFRSPSHFATAFRAVTGVSPRAFRNSSAGG
jgi:AraC family transcriptional regulator